MWKKSGGERDGKWRTDTVITNQRAASRETMPCLHIVKNNWTLSDGSKWGKFLTLNVRSQCILSKTERLTNNTVLFKYMAATPGRIKI